MKAKKAQALDRTKIKRNKIIHHPIPLKTVKERIDYTT